MPPRKNDGVDYGDVEGERRNRFANRKAGTGRVVTRRKWDLQGARTGIVAKENVKRGSDGYDDVDDFFGEDDSTPGGASSRPRRSSSSSSSSSSSAASSSGGGSASRRSSRRAAVSALSEDSDDADNTDPEDDPKRRIRFDASNDAGGFVDDYQQGDQSDQFQQDDYQQDDYDDEQPPQQQQEEEEREDSDEEDEEDEEEDAVVVQPKKTRKQPSAKEKKAAAKAKAAAAKKQAASKKKTASKKRAAVQTPKARAVATPGMSAEMRRQRGSVFEEHSLKSTKKARRDVPSPDGARKSRRQRFEPMQFWKSERVIFEAGEDADPEEELPYGAIGVLEVLPTPASVPTPGHSKPERRKKRKSRKKQQVSDEDDSDSSSDGAGQPAAKKAKAAAAVARFDKRLLPKGRAYRTGTQAEVWWEHTLSVQSSQVVQRAADITAHTLPSTGAREDDEEAVVATASQAFNCAEQATDQFLHYPGWISGHLDLPPGGIKDAEGVGDCTQVFYVVEGQPGSFELGLGKPSQVGPPYDPDSATHFLLSPGDHFYIPPKNVYRMQNYSKTHNIRLFFGILKPVSGPAEE